MKTDREAKFHSRVKSRKLMQRVQGLCAPHPEERVCIRYARTNLAPVYDPRRMLRRDERVSVRSSPCATKQILLHSTHEDHGTEVHPEERQSDAARSCVETALLLAKLPNTVGLNSSAKEI